MVKTKFPVGPEPIAAILDRIAEAHPEAAADRRDGLRLDWPDAWAHVRASNTEPIVRVIAEAADGRPRPVAGRRRSAAARRRRRCPVNWPTFDRPPAGRLPRRRRHPAGRDDLVPLRQAPPPPRDDRPVVRCSAPPYHGLQHKFGRLDYGRLLDYGLRMIREIPLVELERAPTRTSRTTSSRGSTRGSSSTSTTCGRPGRRWCSSRRRPAGDRPARDLSRLHRHPDRPR